MRTLSRNVIGALLGVALLFTPMMSAAHAETPLATYASIVHPAPTTAPTTAPTLDSTVVDPYEDHGILPNERMLHEPDPMVGAAIVGIFVALVLAVGTVLGRRRVRKHCDERSEV